MLLWPSSAAGGGYATSCILVLCLYCLDCFKFVKMACAHFDAMILFYSFNYYYYYYSVVVVLHTPPPEDCSHNSEVVSLLCLNFLLDVVQLLLYSSYYCCYCLYC